MRHVLVAADMREGLSCREALDDLFGGFLGESGLSAHQGFSVRGSFTGWGFGLLEEVR